MDHYTLYIQYLINILLVLVTLAADFIYISHAEIFKFRLASVRLLRLAPATSLPKTSK